MSDKYQGAAAQASYGYGLQIGEQIERAAFDGLEVNAMLDGIRDVMQGAQPQLDEAVISAAFQEITKEIEAKKAEQHKEAMAEGENFLADNGKRPEINKTESGLQYEVLVEGEGESPSASSKVQVHYEGTLISGEVFDSSVQRGQPAEFPVNGVIKGWTEALQRMKVGDKWKLYIPQELAYGSQGAGAAIPPFAALVFEVELLAILG
ncbi:peptidyl-prolyl cis-trans isomerase [Agarivorans sp. OAG1]|uniref:Peptidyl-prolyl cis-trans isomerase n=1 Tax=Agarivorans albus MKT 106 TaxID=1331007 RepID=R9PMK8_AGAAL|nr:MULTISPECIES: FKBP-type peptidyl-prolyl cis-trans isomerase [Agarivorans]MPW27771.1 FKBP-type peptidyl-prolyl cis-trans isomerase [Agarivorans sp. B2Z047]UQN44393.1 FKBP-type peptidyl-prolyl cis-trans isomerase [Agarivorans sp. B2Z047]BEU04218.1 peptidyl-prolyl cis-trans isomerase [Agarivorans sp. OAG1]GAD02627.1 FKBP-type peptidyl-prolyl cis-trans isomerase FklB [Agarivorans albus MKT 106]